MLRIFRNNNPLTVLPLLLFAFLAKFRCLVIPIIPNTIPNHFLYNAVINSLKYFFGNNAFAYSLFAIFILLLQSLYLKYIATKYKLYNSNTYIVSFTYLLFTSIYPPLNYLSEILLINWFILLGLDTILNFPKTLQPQKVIFNAGFLFCIAFLLQSSLFVFLILLIILILLFRSLKLSEFVVAFLGYFTPIYFLTAILFLTDQLNLLPNWLHVGFTIAHNMESPWKITITTICFFILFLSGNYGMQKIVAFNNIHVRRDWYGIFIYLLFSILAALFTDQSIGSAWLIIMPSFSIIVANSFLLENNRYDSSKNFSNFMFYFSLVFLGFCLWAYN